MAALVDKLNSSSTAVVLIEFQNEFATEGGKLNAAVKDCMAHTSMISNTLQIITECRSKGCLVIHCPISFTDDFKELCEKPYGVLGGIKENGCFQASEWGSQIIEIMEPQNGDVVISGKRGACGFYSTNLDFILRQRGITNIAIGGFLTNCCVESTIRTGYEKGFKVIALTDCCAATSVEAHEATIKHTFPMFCHLMSHAEFISQLS